VKRSSVALIEYEGVGEASERYFPVSAPGVLSPVLSQILAEVRRELAAGTEESLIQVISRCSEKLGIELTNFERDEILVLLEKDEKPFGILQGLVDDDRVSDIIVSAVDHISVQQGRRNFRTDLRFANQEEYESYVERLLQRSGCSYSTKKPIADGMVGTARIHAVHPCLAEGGPYLTIRLNRFNSVSLEDLIKVELAPKEILNYLAKLVESGQTVLLAGEVGTGKTTLARALGNSIPSNESILVIEDTPEIKLHHPHVRYIRTREANTDGAGKVAPSECIRGGMRMAMNRIIFGEIRDAEAAEAFIDVCASGHPGLSTIHGRTAAEAISRLELFLGRAQRGVEERLLKEQISNAVQCVVHIGICKVEQKRKILEVREIGTVADGVMRYREIFRYQNGEWRVITRASGFREQLEQGENPCVLSSLPQTLR
jgi:pilus assembly protein CpaF